ncbi:MAG: glycosyl hydrolase family 28-related protein [Saccharofermentanales bacterium]
MDNVVNVMDFGARPGGKNDCAAAIQAAIDSVSDLGGTVLIPAGLYRMKQGVVLPMGVAVEGQTYATTGPWQNWLDSQDKGNPVFDDLHLGSFGESWVDPRLFKGTWILVDHGEGDIDSPPTFRLEGNTAIRKLGFVHRGLPPVSDCMTPYPPAIGAYSSNSLFFTRDGITVEDISLANPYIGIAFTIGDRIGSDYLDKRETDVTKSFGRHRIHNIMGGPLHDGILVKGVLDTVDIHNIQFNYSNYEPNYIRLRMQSATDFHFIRADGMNISNILSFGAYRGIFTEPGYQSKNVSMRAVNINIEAMIPLSFHANGMYEIANSYFLMVNFAGLNESAISRCVEIHSDPGCPHQSVYLFSNCFFQNSIPCSIRENAGRVDDVDDTLIDICFTASHHASFSNCMFWGWGAYKEKTPVITYAHEDGGIPTCNFSDCTFNSESFEGTLAGVSGNRYQSGELVFSNCRFPYSLAIPKDAPIWYKSCSIVRHDGDRSLFDNITAK